MERPLYEFEVVTHKLIERFKATGLSDCLNQWQRKNRNLSSQIVLRISRISVETESGPAYYQPPED
jgi:hypothetical protein